LVFCRLSTLPLSIEALPYLLVVPLHLLSRSRTEARPGGLDRDFGLQHEFLYAGSPRSLEYVHEPVLLLKALCHGLLAAKER
jgi:hypothetical protein